MNGEIYIIKNDINEKVYIGQTTQGSAVRFKQHLKLSKSNKNQLIYKAIRKYGKEHFYFEVLERNVDVQCLDEREEYWISKYDSVKHGYNLCYGGNQSRKPENPILLKYGQDIIDEYVNQDISVRELGRRYNICHCTISHFLKVNNIEINKRNKNKKNLKEEERIMIANMYKKGYSTKEISCEMNLSMKCVRRYKDYCSTV